MEESFHDFWIHGELNCAEVKVATPYRMITNSPRFWPAAGIALVPNDSASKSIESAPPNWRGFATNQLNPVTTIVQEMTDGLDVHLMNALESLRFKRDMRWMAEDNAEASRIMLGLLDAVEQDSAQSQRHLASELGIALGLVNAYIKRCIKKGLVKVREAPARRYVYYLTPKGFAEKSRLTVEYLSYSFSVFRQAKADCSRLLEGAKKEGVTHLLLIGISDLAEVAALCALEHEIVVAGIVQGAATRASFIGAPIFENIESVTVCFDALMITDPTNAQRSFEDAVRRFGVDRVLVPELLRVRVGEDGDKAE